MRRARRRGSSAAALQGSFGVLGLTPQAGRVLGTFASWRENTKSGFCYGNDRYAAPPSGGVSGGTKFMSDCGFVRVGRMPGLPRSFTAHNWGMHCSADPGKEPKPKFHPPRIPPSKGAGLSPISRQGDNDILRFLAQLDRHGVSFSLDGERLSGHGEELYRLSRDGQTHRVRLLRSPGRDDLPLAAGE